MSIVLQSGATADMATVDPTSKALRTTLYDTSGQSIVTPLGAQPATPGGVVAMGMNDGVMYPQRVDRLGSVALSTHQPGFHDGFEGATINPLKWNIVATTMAATQSTVAGVTINSGAITTINTGYMLKSKQAYTKMQRQPLHFKARARIDRYNNSVMELGFGDAATFNGANTTGAYWQVQSGGAVVPVLTFNSVDITGANISGSLTSTDYYTFDVIVDDDEAVFVVQNTATAQIISRQTIQLPLTQQRLFSATQFNVLTRVYNTGVAPASAPRMFLTDAYLAMLDVNLNLQAGELYARLNRSIYENPFTGAQLQTFANSAAPANATLSNTAAGYTTAGGLFSFAAVAGAATDYALFGVQLPATAMISGITIDAWNTGAAVATTPTLLVWGLAYNLTAVSLATASHTRVAVGAQSFPIGAAVGATSQRITQTFDTPLLCPANTFINVILRMPVGTATASQVIQGLVTLDGKFV